jgi:hypothetical protein
MNDEFLTQFLEEPRPEFAEALYERISRQPQPYFARMMGQRLTLRNAALVFAFLFLVAACVYAVTDRGWHKVGGIWVDVERTLELPPQSAEEQTIQPVEPECLTVEEAKKILRFEIHAPAWAPAGFTFENKVCGINELSNYAGLSWAGIGNPGIGLTLSNLRWFNMATQKYEVGPAYLLSPVAPGSYKEVQVNGQPAVLVYGDWDIFAALPKANATRKAEAKWDKKLGLQLHWVEGEILYSLYARENVSVEDLIRMAESTR